MPCIHINEIEKVEVAIRSASLIANSDIHVRTSLFISKTTYSNPYPPAWILSEILPFGVITNIYGNIKNKKIKKRISQAFGLQIDPFKPKIVLSGAKKSINESINGPINVQKRLDFF